VRDLAKATHAARACTDAGIGNMVFTTFFIAHLGGVTWFFGQEDLDNGAK
jgi:hypothetical protein